MTDEVLKALPDILKKHVCTLKKTSLDDTNRKYLSESSIKVVGFDKIPNEFARGRGWRGVPGSNDALYISAQGKWYFIEFKNGRIEKGDIYKKLYDSLIMLIEWGIIPDFEFVRQNIRYILVYNSKHNAEIPDSPERERNYSYFLGLAEEEEKLFGIDKFEKYLFDETHTYTKNLFQVKFVDLMEKEEALATK